MKKNQKGFSAIEVLLVLFVLIVIVCLGLTVSRKKDSATQSPTETVHKTTVTPAQVSSKIPENICGEPKSYSKTDFSYEGWLVFEGSNFNLKYPTDWSVTRHSGSADSFDNKSIFELSTTDYKGAQSEGPLIVEQGASMSVLYRSTKNGGYTIPTRENFLSFNFDGTNSGIAHTVKVNSQVACQYFYDDGPGWKKELLTIFFPSDDYYIETTLVSPSSSGPTDDQIKTYNALNASIEFK